MISSKKELKFYIMADSMMNKGYFTPSAKQRLVDLLHPDPIMHYLRFSRKAWYYKTKKNPLWIYYSWRWQKLGIRLGFRIAYDVFGYGLVVPHHGTIVVGTGNQIGNYAVLFTSTCITEKPRKTIGDGLYLSTGATITTCEKLGSNVTIAANSVVAKSFSEENNILLAGMPATVKKQTQPWYIRDGAIWESRVERCEELRKKMKLFSQTD